MNNNHIYAVKCRSLSFNWSNVLAVFTPFFNVKKAQKANPKNEQKTEPKKLTTKSKQKGTHELNKAMLFQGHQGFIWKKWKNNQNKHKTVITKNAVLLIWIKRIEKDPCLSYGSINNNNQKHGIPAKSTLRYNHCGTDLANFKQNNNNNRIQRSN